MIDLDVFTGREPRFKAPGYVPFLFILFPFERSLPLEQEIFCLKNILIPDTTTSYSKFLRVRPPTF